MKKILTVFAALALTLTLASCDDYVPSGDEVIHVTSVEVDESAKNLTLEVDETFTFGTKCVTVLPEDATNKSYTLSSSNTSVFTTSGYVITGIGEGSATLTVTTTDGGFTDTASVTVVGIGGDENPNPEPDPNPEPEPDPNPEPEPDPEPEYGTISLSFNSESYTVTEYDTVFAGVNVDPSDAEVTYTIADSDIATCTKTDNGVNIYGNSNGTTTITATAKLDGYYDATDSADIVVNEYVPENQDITINLTTNSYTLTEGTTETLGFTIEPSDPAINVSVVSDAPAYVSVTEDETSGVWTIHANQVYSGATLTITASCEGYNTATEQVTVTVEAVPDVYTYGFVIANKDSVPTNWKFNTNETFTVEPQLVTYKNGTAEGTSALTSGEVTLSGGENIVTINDLTISPVGVGTATITATYTGSEAITETNNYDTFIISVADDYATTHELSITKDGIPNTITIGDEGISLEDCITLTTTTTSLSSSESTSTSETATASDVTFTFAGDGVFTQSGLTLVPTSAGEVTVTVTWTDYASETPIPADSFTITIEEPAVETYRLTIVNEAALKNTWYTEDGDRTIEYAVVSNLTEQPVSVDSSEISVTSDQEGVVGISGLTLSPIGSGTTTITVQWTEHNEAVASFQVTVGEHWYELTINNAEEMSQDWSLEEGSRTLDISLSTDNTSADTNPSSSTVEVSYEEGMFTASADGLTLTPTEAAVTAGEVTISVTWIGHETATASITVHINDYIKVASVSLDNSSISLEAPDATETLTATLLGKDGTPATSAAVTWSSDNPDGVSVSGDGLTATVTALAYDATATITATSEENTDAYATCTVTVQSEPVTAVYAKVIDGSAKPTIVDVPDDNGVYVIGTEDGSHYIGVSGNNCNVVTTYGEAAAVRMIASDGGYAFKIGDNYLSDGLNPGDTEPQQTFVVSGSGITLGENTLYIGEDGLSTSGTNKAYIIDYTFYEHEESTLGGEYYLEGVHSGYDPAYFSGSTSSNKLTTVDHPQDAVKITLEHISDNEYYMKYGSYYISVGSSSDAGYSTTAAKIYYDSTNDVWQNSDGSRYLGTNLSGSDVIFGSYTYSSGSVNNQYSAVSLYTIEDIPYEKGISLTASSSSVEESNSVSTTIKYYPTCETSFEKYDFTWTWSSNDGGQVTINDNNGVITAVSTGHVTVTATLGHSPYMSDSTDIEIVSNTTGTKTLIYEHTFATGELGSNSTGNVQGERGTEAGTSASLSGLVWSYSATHYKGFESSNNARGVQIGAGNSSEAQTDVPFTLSTDFGEEVKLTSITLGLSVASSGGGQYSITLGSNEIATNVAFSKTTVEEYTHSDLSVEGQNLTISLLSTKEKAMYIHDISMTIEVGLNSTLTFG